MTAYEFQHKGKTWLLHVKHLELRQGIQRDFYFFCRQGKKPASGEPCALPSGKEVGINTRTGMPFLRNK